MLIEKWNNKPSVTNHVDANGVVHIRISKKGNQSKAIEAFERLKAVAIAIKPDPVSGGTAAMRSLRDGN